MIRPAALIQTALPSKPKPKTNSEARRLKPRGNLAVFCLCHRTHGRIYQSERRAKAVKKKPGRLL